MVNINKSKNRELLQNCTVLGDYMTLINRIRENREQGMAAEDAIDRAVQYCIEENILADFLLKNRGEVLNVCLTEFNREVYENGIRAEGIALGKQQGMLQGLTKTATAMLAKGFAPEVVAECTGLSQEQVMQLVPRS